MISLPKKTPLIAAYFCMIEKKIPLLPGAAQMAKTVEFTFPKVAHRVLKSREF